MKRWIATLSVIVLAILCLADFIPASVKAEVGMTTTSDNRVTSFELNLSGLADIPDAQAPYIGTTPFALYTAAVNTTVSAYSVAANSDGKPCIRYRETNALHESSSGAVVRNQHLLKFVLYATPQSRIRLWLEMAGESGGLKSYVKAESDGQTLAAKSFPLTEDSAAYALDFQMGASDRAVISINMGARYNDNNAYDGTAYLNRLYLNIDNLLAAPAAGSPLPAAQGSAAADASGYGLTVSQALLSAYSAVETEENAPGLSYTYSGTNHTASARYTLLVPHEANDQATTFWFRCKILVPEDAVENRGKTTAFAVRVEVQDFSYGTYGPGGELKGNAVWDVAASYPGTTAGIAYDSSGRFKLPVISNAGTADEPAYENTCGSEYREYRFPVTIPADVTYIKLHIYCDTGVNTARNGHFIVKDMSFTADSRIAELNQDGFMTEPEAEEAAPFTLERLTARDGFAVLTSRNNAPVRVWQGAELLRPGVDYTMNCIEEQGKRKFVLRLSEIAKEGFGSGDALRLECVSGATVYSDALAAEVTLDVQRPLFTSHFSFGTTQTHYFWFMKNQTAVASAKALLQSVSAINNQHIVSFGASNLQSSQGAPLDFTSLDARVANLRSLGGECMLTLCSAPGWMLESEPESGYDPESRPKEIYFDEYASICAAVAQRYPDVKYFQVWNEFKGFWNAETGWWDDALYLTFYNKIYTAVKAVRPDAYVGGFYMSIRGDGSEMFGYQAVDSYDPLDEEADGNLVWKSMRYWLQNKAGADFICFDRGLQGWNNNAAFTPEQALDLTQKYEDILTKIRSLTDLPLVMSEFYGLRPSRSSFVMSADYKAVMLALMYKHMLMGSQGRELTALLWSEEDSTGMSLFTDTEEGGGQPTSLYRVANGFISAFAQGNTIVQSTSTNTGKIEVLASPQVVMLINKSPDRQTIRCQGQYYSIDGYAVEFLDLTDE